MTTKNNEPAFPCPTKSYPKGGCTVKQFFPGMVRICKNGHKYAVTDAMSRRGRYPCPRCAVITATEYGKKNIEWRRAQQKKYQAKITSRRAGNTARYRARYPEKKSAHYKVQNAIRTGRIVRLACEVCGCKNSHAHHSDYTNPMDVKWLCHRHHMEVHWPIKQLKEGE